MISCLCFRATLGLVRTAVMEGQSRFTRSAFNYTQLWRNRTVRAPAVRDDSRPAAERKQMRHERMRSVASDQRTT